MSKRSSTTVDQVELLSISQGFVSSSILFALMRLGVLTRLVDGETNVEDLAAVTGARTHLLERLLDSATMLGLLEATAAGYAISPALRPLVASPDDPRYLGDWLGFMEGWYEPFGKLDQFVKGERSHDMYRDDAAVVRRNTLAMHNFAAFRGRELVRFLDLSDCRTMVDVGCGPGTYSFELGMRYPDLQLNLVDRAEVLDVAREVAGRYELGDRVKFLPLDLSVDTLPGEYDVALVSNALQAFGANEAAGLVGDIFGRVASGGSIVVQAQFLQDDRRGPRWPSYVDLACLVFTENGRNHTVPETIEWLERAGCERIVFEPMSVLNANGFVRGWKP